LWSIPPHAPQPDQPYIHRLTRLGCAAAETPHGLDFLNEMSRTIWSGENDRTGIEGDHLAKAAARAGPRSRGARSQDREADPGKYEAIIQANQKAHQDAGHWGVPTMAFEGEPFFGQDRLDVLLVAAEADAAWRNARKSEA
jgi:2-hydroxychromene-2-carboxylate isomerase